MDPRASPAHHMPDAIWAVPLVIAAVFLLAPVTARFAERLRK